MDTEHIPCSGMVWIQNHIFIFLAGYNRRTPPIPCPLRTIAVGSLGNWISEFTLEKYKFGRGCIPYRDMDVLSLFLVTSEVDNEYT